MQGLQRIAIGARIAKDSNWLRGLHRIAIVIIYPDSFCPLTTRQSWLHNATLIITGDIKEHIRVNMLILSVSLKIQNTKIIQK